MTLKILNSKEVKLNKLLQKKSEIINWNKKIKSEIDHFRRLRLQTDSSHTKIEAILTDSKAGIKNYIPDKHTIFHSIYSSIFFILL